MSRRNKPEPPNRVTGDKMLVAFLPRDIKTVWTKNSPKGTLLLGWCLTTDTMQLWETTSSGEQAEAVFVGFVCKEWSGNGIG